MTRLAVDETYLREQLLALLAVPSPTGLTGDVVRRVCGELEALEVPFELALGVRVGDFVALDPGTEITPDGYVVSRFLDNKAGVAALLAAVRAVRRAGAELPVDCHLLFTVHEEVGTGAAGIVPAGVSELVSVDIGTVGSGQTTRETSVTVCRMDATGPFDRDLSEALLDLAREHVLPAVADVFRFYRSDAASALAAGHDVRTALVCFGADASHHYERTHVRSIVALAELLAVYLQSGIELR